ncbi:hypothetical protein SEA_WEASELS2_227 [Rhodococcus phage Weasels2]|uniref:Uncharacterized protein n=1 Tax=Rhodococcus phage Weasels2 TaxID=1897437 RepID=A0A1I9SAJ9_9CAUD|nr:hypothetical protein FDH04_gp189 [Rhodococcus phage Weasels2]AOZ63805.1 hypothetical protein SEA_WEASELS2_227 [Rhodococcus phage Weasels2]
MPWTFRKAGGHRCNTREAVEDLYAGLAYIGDQWSCEECGLVWLVMEVIPQGHEVICIDRPNNRSYLVNSKVKNSFISEGTINE